jgi:hypothetical protein
MGITTNKPDEVQRMTIPIMTPDQARFMAFEGLLKWTNAVVVQAARISEAQKHVSDLDLNTRRLAIGSFQAECDYLAIAANKLLEFKEWTVEDFGLCTAVDFSEIESFSRDDIRALRNKREHILEYFKGESTSGWWVETADYKGDASGVAGALIGGRLDWRAFGAAAQRLLPKLLAEPIPFRPRAA